MKKYEIRKNENTFEIVEKATNFIIVSYNRKYKSHDLLNKLNSGGGFDGWTPNFFIKNIKKSANSV